MKTILFCALFLSTTALFGQSVSPLVVECGKRCSGSFTVSNDGLRPMSVVVEPYSFSLSPKSETLFRQLDSTVTVELSETSARVGPKSEHTFDYDIHCQQLPCMVAITSGMVIGHTVEGLAVRLVVPHIVYVDEKGKGARARLRLQAGLEQ